MQLTYKTFWGAKIEFNFDPSRQRVQFRDGREVPARIENDMLVVYYEPDLPCFVGHMGDLV